MKKKIPMICNIISILLVVAFIIKSIVDYTQYTTTLNLAPFSLWIVANAVFMLIPAIVVFIIGFIAKKKPARHEKRPQAISD